MSAIQMPEISIADRILKEEEKLDTKKFIELKDKLALQNQPQPEPTVIDVEPTLRYEITSEDAFKRPIKLVVNLSNNYLKWGVLERAAAAKMDPTSAWFESSLPTIINAVVFADRQGLSFEEGDVYKTKDSTKFSLTAQARIKRALAFRDEHGEKVVVKYKFEITSPSDAADPNSVYKFTPVFFDKQEITYPNYHIKVTVTIKDWDEPMIYEADLSEWAQVSNTNWRRRPRHMLMLNAVGHAMSMITPGATTSEEAPD